MYFILLVIEKLTGWHKPKGKLLTIIKWLYTMLFVVLGWVLFRAETVKDALYYLKRMFGLGGVPFADGMFTGYLKQNLILLILGIALSTPIIPVLKRKLGSTLMWDVLSVVGLIFLFILSMASLVSNSYNPFIYFNF